MRITVRYIDRHQDGCNWAERSVFFAVDQFASRIRFVAAELRDEHGSRGDVDQKYLMFAHLDNGERVVVRVTNADPLAAVSRATEHLGRRVQTIIDRKRTVIRLTGKSHSLASHAKGAQI